MADWHTNFPRFQVARSDHVQVESSRYCCLRALESFVRPRALDSFDQWHVTRTPPIKKRILVWRYNNKSYPLLDIARTKRDVHRLSFAILFHSTVSGIL